jgi:D-threo-aldose 1-dehydrogenase
MPSASNKRPLGQTGLSVSVLGLGSAPLGDLYEIIPEQRAEATVTAAWDLGVRLYDTAPLYGQGIAEHRLGHVLRQHWQDRGDFVLCTKVGRYLVPEQRDKVNRGVFKGGLDFRLVDDYGYDGTMRAYEQSIQRLGMNRVDVIHIHDVDLQTWHDDYPKRFREAVGGAYKALDQLRRAGDIKAIGVGVNEVQPLLEFAEAGDFDCFMLAGRYTLLEQGALDRLLPVCQLRGIGILTAGPFNSGILATGAVAGAKYNYKPAPPEILDRVAKMEAVCKRYGVPLAAAAVQFPLAHPAVAAMVPGAVRPEEVEANIRLIETPIPAALWEELRQQKLIRADAPVPT